MSQPDVQRSFLLWLATLLTVAVRVIHLAAVLVALALMFSSRGEPVLPPHRAPP